MKRLREPLSLLVLGAVIGLGTVVVPIGLRPLAEPMGPGRQTVDRLAAEDGTGGAPVSPALAVAAGPPDAPDDPGVLGASEGAEPVAGIVLPRQGACGDGYELLDGVCYHRRLGQDEFTQQRLIADYKQGKRPPLVIAW